MNTPLLDAIKKAATQSIGQIPDAGFTSGLNNVLTPPPDQKMPKVQTLENAEKVRNSLAGSSSKPTGPRATMNLNSASVANYRPTMGGFKQ